VDGPGKGDKRRPSFVSDRAFAENWDAIDWAPTGKFPKGPKKKGAGWIIQVDKKRKTMTVVPADA
jgi:hypothetical protein